MACCDCVFLQHKCICIIFIKWQTRDVPCRIRLYIRSFSRNANKYIQRVIIHGAHSSSKPSVPVQQHFRIRPPPSINDNKCKFASRDTHPTKSFANVLLLSRPKSTYLDILPGSRSYRQSYIHAVIQFHLIWSTFHMHYANGGVHNNSNITSTMS